jgi:hypothetical protein
VPSNRSNYDVYTEWVSSRTGRTVGANANYFPMTLARAEALASLERSKPWITKVEIRRSKYVRPEANP